MSDFKGKVALVTGGAWGIGAAIAAEMSCHGAKVAVLDRDTTAAVPGVFAVRADVTSEEAVSAAVQQCRRWSTTSDSWTSWSTTQAQEVADAVCYLAGPRAGSTTGVGLTIDGGLVGLRLRR